MRCLPEKPFLSAVILPALPPSNCACSFKPGGRHWLKGVVNFEPVLEDADIFSSRQKPYRLINSTLGALHLLNPFVTSLCSCSVTGSHVCPKMPAVQSFEHKERARPSVQLCPSLLKACYLASLPKHHATKLSCVPSPHPQQPREIFPAGPAPSYKGARRSYRGISVQYADALQSWSLSRRLT